MKKVFKLFVVFVSLIASGCTYKSSLSTYTGQCGPVFFDYAELEFDSLGGVVSIEKGGKTLRLSNMPCVFKKDE